MILFPRCDELALIPPLELPEAHAGHLGDIGTEEDLLYSAAVRALRWKHWHSVRVFVLIEIVFEIIWLLTT